MDTWEAATIVFERVRAVDPENARKIVGTLLVADDTGAEKEMIRLAFGPDDLLRSAVARARAEIVVARHSSAPPPSSFALGPVQAAGRRPWGRSRVPPSPVEKQMVGRSDGGGAVARKPCRFFNRGVCRNGGSCRFLHAAAVTQRAVPSLVAARQQQQQQQPSPIVDDLASCFPFSPFSVRSPRVLQYHDEFNIDSPAARHIYLTFPPESIFTEEDASNYFSTYGPVQDVRIPFQEKRMFGFVTFIYPETVKLVFAKGNPHFIGDARVLVKPYKEKGSNNNNNVVPNNRLIRHGGGRARSPLHHAELFPGAGCMTTTPPTGLFPFGLQQQLIGGPAAAGMMLTPEAILRRNKLLVDQQRQQAAIELRVGMQLLALNNNRSHHHNNHLLGSSNVWRTMGQTYNNDGRSVIGNNDGNNAVRRLDDVVTVQGNNKLSLNGSCIAMGAAASSVIPATADAQGSREEQLREEDGDGTDDTRKQAVKLGVEEKREESGGGPVAATTPLDVAAYFQESSVMDDHNHLPESLLSSPVKAAPQTTGDIRCHPHHRVASSSSLFIPGAASPPSSSLDELPPYNSCFFQVPTTRFASAAGSGHEAAFGL